MTRLPLFLSLTILLFLIMGCSGVETLNPTTPDSSLPQIRVISNGSSHSLWGYWQCELDTETLEFNAVPDRTAMIHINAVKPLNSTLGMSVDISSDSTPATGYFKLTVSLTHPFAGNPKLTGFDVRGIMITTAGLTAGSMHLPGDMDPKILNPDGYSRWWNPTEFPTPGLLGYTPGIYGKDPPPDKPLVSTINPYKQFADGLYVTSDISFLTLILPTSANGRGVFKSGATNSRQYEIQFPLNPGPKVYFNYAVDASWAPPVGDPPQIPNGFPLEANADEGFIVKAKVTDSTLWAAGGPQAGGDINLEIELWDWEGWLEGYEGEIGALTLVSPYCDFDDNVVPEWDTPGIGNAILTATVPGVPTQAGVIPIWVGVTAPGSNYQQGGAPAPNAQVSAYAFVTVEVVEAECQDNGNDNCSSAEDVNPDDLKDGLLCLDVDDADWFHFSVLTGGSATGSIYLHTWNVGDLNLFLYEGCPPSLLDYSSATGTADEEIVLDGLPEGEYYIQVLEADDGDNSPRPYTLETSIENIGEKCTTDDNNIPGDAWTIQIVGTKSDTICLIGDPVEWYTFDISPGATGFGQISLDNKDTANNDIALYDDSISTPLYIGDNTGTVDELLDVVLEYGSYFIRIDAMDADPPGDRPYTLQVNIDEIISDCDDADGNNFWDQADTIGLVDEKTGTVCHPTDPDWFSFHVGAAGADGTVTLSSGDLYDNDLYLYSNPFGAPIMQSEQVGTMEEILTVVLEEGTYYIKASASPDAVSVNQGYTLTTNLSGTTWGPTDIFLHVHIVRTNAGENPAASVAKVNDDIAWASEFWGIWVDGSINLDEITYIDKTSWLSATTDESIEMFDQYGTNDGTLNVFYVNDFPDMPGAAAYAWMDCQFIFQDHTSGFIMMSDYADSATLPHEAFHAAGMLGDLYWLDWYTCDDVTYCPSGPSDVNCDEADAVWGNLMYWPIGSNINDYFLSNDDLYHDTPLLQSQGEHVMFFHTDYPDAFYKP